MPWHIVQKLVGFWLHWIWSITWALAGCCNDLAFCRRLLERPGSVSWWIGCEYPDEQVLAAARNEQRESDYCRTALIIRKGPALGRGAHGSKARTNNGPRSSRRITDPALSSESCNVGCVQVDLEMRHNCTFASLGSFLFQKLSIASGEWTSLRSKAGPIRNSRDDEDNRPFLPVLRKRSAAEQGPGANTARYFARGCPLERPSRLIALPERSDNYWRRRSSNVTVQKYDDSRSRLLSCGRLLVATKNISGSQGPEMTTYVRNYDSVGPADPLPLVAALDQLQHPPQLPFSALTRSPRC